MSWTPTTIGQKAGAIESYALDIDRMLWHVQQYKVERREQFADDIDDRIARLKSAIAEFNELDTDAIMDKLDKEIKLFRKGVL